MAGEVEECDLCPGSDEYVHRLEQLAPADIAIGSRAGVAFEVWSSVLVVFKERQQRVDVVDAATQGREILVIVDADEERSLHRVTD